MLLHCKPVCSVNELVQLEWLLVSFSTKSLPVKTSKFSCDMHDGFKVTARPTYLLGSYLPTWSAMWQKRWDRG